MISYLISFFVQPPVIAVSIGTLIIAVGLCRNIKTEADK